MIRVLVLMVLSWTAATLAVAGETGHIRGQLTDLDGLDLPGARVVLSGAELAGERSTESVESGEFRIDGLAPGEYVLTVWWNGAPAASATVEVNLDRTTHVPLSVDLNASAEEIEVVTIKPVIDSTSSAVGHSMPKDVIQNLPVGRTPTSVAKRLPGVVGNSVRGEGAQGNNFTVDGVSNRDPTNKGSGTFINFDAIEDIQIYTDGAPAEFGQFTGMMVNVVTKDGGDEHHGSAALLHEQHMFAKPTYSIWSFSEGREQETQKAMFYEPRLNITAGGPIVREKLWYFSSLDTSYLRSMPTGVDPDFASNSFDGQVMGKLTWFPTARTVLRYAFTYQRDMDLRGDAAPYRSPEATSDVFRDTLSHMLTANWSPSPDTTLVVRTGLTQIVRSTRPTTGSLEAPAWQPRSGEHRGNARFANRNARYRVGGGFTLSQRATFLGEHTFKLGADYWLLAEQDETTFAGLTEIEWRDVQGNPTGEMLQTGTSYKANNKYDYDCTREDYSDCGIRIHQVNVGTIGWKSHTWSAFLQDDWRPTKRLYLNLGVRTDIEDPRNDMGERPTTQDPSEYHLPYDERQTGTLNPMVMVSPRVGLSWDITGDNKTKAFLNYGHYYDIAGNGLWKFANRRSANREMRFERNEGGEWEWLSTEDPESSPYLFSPNLRPAYKQHLIIGFEREVVPLLSLGIRAIRSKTHQFTENANLTGADWFVLNSDIKRRDYRGLEFVLDKKFDDRWQMLASYTLSETMGNMPGTSWGNAVSSYLDDVGEEASRAALYEAGRANALESLKGLGRYSVTDPEFQDSAGTYGYLKDHSFHQVKVTGSYAAPWGSILGFGYLYDSGTAWSKEGFVPVQGWHARFQGRGTRFMPAKHDVRLRIAHRVPMRKGSSMEASLDIFNVLDAQRPVRYQARDNAGFGSVLYRQSPRAFRAMLKYRW